MVFEDRRDAGRKLGEILKTLREWGNAVVLGLPRGGVPVAFEVARALNLPLDIFIVRKLGVPGQEELAMGAVASDGTMVLNEAILREASIGQHIVEVVAHRERAEIERREQVYRDGRPPVKVDSRPVILVDDGLATGATMLAAARALKPRAREIIVAAPLGSEDTCNLLSREVNHVVCPTRSRTFSAVGALYRRFDPTSDQEVKSLLAEARQWASQEA